MHAVCPVPQSCPTLHNPAACQAPLPMGFFRQEDWSGLPFPTPGHLPNLGTEPASLGSLPLVGRFFTTKPPVLSRFSCVRLFVTLWTVAHQVPLSMGFSRQEYWCGLLCSPFRVSSEFRDRTHVTYIYLHWQEGSLRLVLPGKPSLAPCRLAKIMR